SATPGSSSTTSTVVAGLAVDTGQGSVSFDRLQSFCGFGAYCFVLAACGVDGPHRAPNVGRRIVKRGNRRDVKQRGGCGVAVAGDLGGDCALCLGPLGPGQHLLPGGDVTPDDGGRLLIHGALQLRIAFAMWVGDVTYEGSLPDVWLFVHGWLGGDGTDGPDLGAVLNGCSTGRFGLGAWWGTAALTMLAFGFGARHFVAEPGGPADVLSVLPGANVHSCTFVGGLLYSDAYVIVDGFGCTPTIGMYYDFGIETETAVDHAFRCDWARLSPFAAVHVGEASHPGPAGLKAKWRKQSGLTKPITKGDIARVCRSVVTEFLEQWAAHQPPQRGSWDDWRQWPRASDQEWAAWRASEAEWHNDHDYGHAADSATTWDGWWNDSGASSWDPSWGDVATGDREGADAWSSWASASDPSWDAAALEGARAGRAVSYYGASAKAASADCAEPVRVVTTRRRWDDSQGAAAKEDGEPRASKARWKKRRGKADTPGVWRLDVRVWKASTAIGFAYSAASFSHELDVSSGVAWLVYVQTAEEAEEVFDMYQADKDEERATDLSLLFPVTSDASELPAWAEGAISVAVPGHDQGRLCTRRCWLVVGGTAPPTLATRATEAVVLKKPPVSLPVLRASTFVVRASFDKAFGEDHWEDIVRKPSHFARLWAGASGVAQAGIIDAFGFQRSGTRITGMLRLRTPDAASRLWKCSGQLANGTRWFIDLVGEAKNLPFAQDVGVQWLPWTSDETYGDYIARAAAKSGLGLVLGRGIGVRLKRSDPSYQRPSVMWRMRSIPSHFMMNDVKELAEMMGFEAVVMSTRHRTRRGYDWCFRAVRGDALQIVSQAVQWDPDDPSSSEVVVLKESARRGSKLPAGEAIAEPRTVTFSDALAAARGPGAPQRAARKTRATDARRAPSAPDASSGVPRGADAVTSPAPTKKRDAPGEDPGESMTVDSEGSAPGSQWGPPGEWLTNNGQGNCLVLALSQLNLGGRERTHRQLRRFIVAAFQEYRGDLEPLWQKAGRFNTIGRLPGDGHAFSWEQFVEEFSANSSWGGTLELLALAWALDCRVWVCTSQQQLFLLNEDASEGHVTLHYDVKEEHWSAYKDVPEQALRDRHDATGNLILDVTTQLLRGGGTGGRRRLRLSDCGSTASPASAARGPMPHPVQRPARRRLQLSDCASSDAGEARAAQRRKLTLSECASTSSEQAGIRATACSGAGDQSDWHEGQRALHRQLCDVLLEQPWPFQDSPGLERALQDAGGGISLSSSGWLDVLAFVSDEVQLLRADAADCPWSAQQLRCIDEALVALRHACDGGKRTVWTALAAVAKLTDAGACPPVSVEDAEASHGADRQDVGAAPVVHPYFRRGSTCNPARQDDGSFVEPCAYCPHVLRGATGQDLARRRYDHYKRWHPDVKRSGGRPFHPSVPLVRLASRSPADWRCPLCNFGVPVGGCAGHSRAALDRTRNEHRLQAHPGYSRSQFRMACISKAHSCGVHAMKGRVAQLNRRLGRRKANEGDVGIEGFTAFTWPRLAQRRGKPSLHMHLAWRCDRCLRSFKETPLARAHVCTSAAPGTVARRKRALSRLWKRCRGKEHEHGVDDRTLRSVVDRAGAPKLASIVSLMRDPVSRCDILCLQEIDVPTRSAASFQTACSNFGLHLYLDEASQGVHRTAILSTVQGLSVRLGTEGALRCNAAVFELWQDDRYIKVLVASIHACAWDPQLALVEVTRVVESLKQSRLEWALLGDFNLDPHDWAMSQAISRGLAWHWDEPFVNCPATRESGRRLDYALGTGRIFPTAVHHTWTFSDHAMVGYDVDLFSPPGCAGPTRFPLRREAVEDSVWLTHWGDGALFRQLLEDAQVDQAWTLLSDCAEAVLRVDGGDSSRAFRPRSSPWRPVAARPVSKAAEGVESLLAVQLRRLHRRLCHLRCHPGEGQLRAVVMRQLRQLASKVPELAALRGAAPEAGVELVSGLVAELETSSRDQALHTWRKRMREEPGLARAWVKRRARAESDLKRPIPPVGSVTARQSIHPTAVVSDAEKQWMEKWGRLPSSGGCAAVRNLLASVPDQPSLDDWMPDLSASNLLRIAKTMVGKAPGPDNWRVEEWILLPSGFWEALSLLWRQVLRSGQIPERWTEGKVVLIPKPSTGMRPLTVLAIGWRLGAKTLAQSLRSWTTSWADCRTMGGMAKRSVRDVYLRFLDALANPDHCFVKQDLSKFFDSVQIPLLLVTLEKFGAPPLLRALVRGFYASHWRMFSYMGVHGKGWRRITCGLAQGCPLSPVLVAVLMATWSFLVERPAPSDACVVSTASFVDDRLVWCASADVLHGAMARSDVFDRVFNLDCDITKCLVGCRPEHAGGAALALTLGYSVAHDFFELLGVRFALDCSQAPTVSRFALDKARRLFHFIGISPTSALMKKMMVRSLVLPLAFWAGGFARISIADLQALNDEALFLLGKRNVCDAARVVLYEVTGWEMHPTYAYRRAALDEAVRFHSCAPAWIEEASLVLASRKWFDLLPVSNEVIRELGWWVDPSGSTLFRRDSVGVVRRFDLGIDARAVLHEWLRDVMRREMLARCLRVAKSLHRPEAEDLAQGLVLPGPPPGSLCIFAGHVAAWREAKDGLERATALAGGCTYWYKQRRAYDTGFAPGQSVVREQRCLCGLRKPSRPHLVWSCPHTRSYRQHLDAPSTRLEERLFARPVPELPRPPGVVDYLGYIEDIAEAIDIRLARSPSSTLFVATDGSVIDTVAAWALVFEDEQSFAQGIAAEDQSPHRAELEGLLALFRALERCKCTGVVHVICDCQAALLVAEGGGCERLMAGLFTALLTRLRCRFEVHCWWCPSHDKVAPVRWLPPPCGEVRARRLNAYADAAARRQAGRLAAGSARQRCMMSRRAAASWERDALTALRSVARVWMDA
ncbi:unnamed protein product, partial [Symbiodinium sp. KB8]